VDGKILSVIQNKRGRSYGGGPFVYLVAETAWMSKKRSNSRVEKRGLRQARTGRINPRVTRRSSVTVLIPNVAAAFLRLSAKAAGNGKLLI